jgi:hypothetical protein
MQMKQEDIGKYRHFHRYVSKELKEVPSAYPSVYKAFVTICCSGAEDSRVSRSTVKGKADQGLVWPNRPIVLIGEIDPLGETNPKTRRITLKASLINKYESECEARSKGKKLTKSYYFLIQYLLLHELVHWVRFESGLPLDVVQPVDPKAGRDKSKGKERKSKLAEIDLGHSVIGPKSVKSVTSEAGDAFENLAYGGDMSGSWSTGLSLDWRPKGGK